MIAIVLVRADEGHIKRFALAQAESAGMVLAIVVMPALTSLLAVIFELIAAKAAGPHHIAGHLVFGAVTVFGSWLLLPTLFALTYASAYYGPDPDRGLAFPDAPRLRARPHRFPLFLVHHRRHRTDFRHRRDDAKDASPRLWQSVLSFVFNTTILAFADQRRGRFF